MRSLLVRVLALVAIAGSSGAFLVSNSASSGRFVFEKVPSDRRPINVFVDSDPVTGVANPVQWTQQLMNDWNAVPGIESLFGTAQPGGSFTGTNAKSAFGIFTNRTHEVAFDDDGTILAAYGLSTGVLGITLKVVNSGSGNVLDFLIVINTSASAMTPPVGSGASREELFRGTLLHELGHSLGIGHSPVGMSSNVSYGLLTATASQIPTMYPCRLPSRPQEGATLEEDDRAAVRFRYANVNIGRGSISGRVRALSGAPANAIAVRAVGPGASNQEHIGALTNVDGSDQGGYTIPDLPPGGYQVLIETVNGRSGVTAGALSAVDGPLGSDPFLLAQDELWEPGDTYDPVRDNPQNGATVQVRAERDTGSVNFTLNATPLFAGAAHNGVLGNGDARVPGTSAQTHYTDFFVLQGSSGQTISLQVSGSGFTPQIRLYRPANLAEEAEQLPSLGTSTTLNHTLQRSGVYTVAVSARGSSIVSSGRGSYSVQLTGAGSGLPAPTNPTNPVIEQGAANPFSQEVGSPSSDVGILQLRLAAGNAEELWLDELVVHGSGTGNERAHLTAVELVHDRDGDGRADSNEPVLATAAFDANDGMARFTGINLEVDPGQSTHVLVAYSVDVPAPVQAAGYWTLAAMLLLAPLVLLRRRAAWLILIVLPLACGGGGNEVRSARITAFDPNQPAFTFDATVGAGDVRAFTSAGDPNV
ncbi:MAG: hypothetical protein ACYS0E_01595, partial [Planctomycetota bacterium]